MHDFSTRKPLFHKFSFYEFDYNSILLKSLKQINVICNPVLSSALLSWGLFTCMWRVLSHRDKLAQHVHYFQTVILRSLPIAVRKPYFELCFCILKKIIYSKICIVSIYFTLWRASNKLILLRAVIIFRTWHFIISDTGDNSCHSLSSKVALSQP